jgi:hypothetical protein
MSSPAKYYCLLIDVTMLQVNISWKVSEFYVCSLNIVGITEKRHKSSDALLIVIELWYLYSGFHSLLTLVLVSQCMKVVSSDQFFWFEENPNTVCSHCSGLLSATIP